MSEISWLKRLPGDRVYSLRDAQSSLLQVLLSEFVIERSGHGFTLNVSFSEDDLAIRRREAKKYLEEKMPGYPDKWKDVQATIDAVFWGEGTKYHHNDKDFLFRYASGGTLPIVELESKWYYCLFYRDVNPVGWNIANGSCDSIPELLDPKLTVERELREELMVLKLHPDKPVDYQFTWEGEEGVSVLEYKYARRLASVFLADESNINRDFYRRALAVDWANPGPDTLRIRYKNEETRSLSGFYLNINAKDYGIELDRIARIRLPAAASLLDGEINNNQLLNQPIGLFEVEKTKKAFNEDQEAFLPDRVFYSGAAEFNSAPSSPDDFRQVFVRKVFLERLLRNGIRTPKGVKNWEKLSTPETLALCPVTRSIIGRHIKSARPKVFISYSHRDSTFAEDIERDLKNRDVEVWLDKRDIVPGQAFDVQIEEALKASTELLLLASQHSVTREWVRDELHFARSREKAVIVLMLEPCEVPIVGIRSQRIDFQNRYAEALEELLRYLATAGSAKRQ